MRRSIWLIRLWTSVRDVRTVPRLNHDLLLPTCRSTMSIWILSDKLAKPISACSGVGELRNAAEVSLNHAGSTETAALERLNNGMATAPEVQEARAATAKAACYLRSAIGVRSSKWETSQGNYHESDEMVESGTTRSSENLRQTRSISRGCHNRGVQRSPRLASRPRPGAERCSRFQSRIGPAISVISDTRV
jgi:hypothetical protein